MLGFLALVLLLVVLFAGAVIFDSLFGSDTADFANTQYENGDGNVLAGYLASGALIIVVLWLGFYAKQAIEDFGEHWILRIESLMED
jgi:hypothetical protein